MAGLVLGVVLAAWQVPNRLDWGRYKSGIAAIASARLGRPVSIDGNVRLSLLPEVVLTASRVTLADRGDGISAKIGALRLRVALAPLLRGQILPRDLVLDHPTLLLPWPLPPDIAAPASARLPKGFSARLEGGTLRLGGMTMAGFSAALRSDADTGAFAANGVLTGLAQGWRYSALLGAPGADGVSTLNLTADGQGGAQNTGGYFRGRMLPSGAVEGVVSARGPDLSLLIAAPAAAWQVAGAITASGLQVQAPSLALSVGGSPGNARLSLSLQEPFGLSGNATIGQVDLGAWATSPITSARPALPVHIDMTATAGALPGGTARSLHGVLSLARTQARLDNASATLPGGTEVALAGDLIPGGYAGKFTLRAPDLPATLRWLAPFAPRFFQALPKQGASQAALHGDLRIDGQGAAVSGLSGTLGGSDLSADASLGFGADRRFGLALRLGHVDLDRLESVTWADVAALAGTGADGHATIDAGSATWHGVRLTALKLEATTGPAGLTLRKFAFEGSGFKGAAAGTLGPNGALSGVTLSAGASNATSVLAALPAGWRRFPGLWQGSFDLAASASGKPDGMQTQLRADIGDLRLEADGTLDLPRRQAEATVTLRHPGAPRLLHGLGVEESARWLETGSVALAAHLHAQPGRVDVHDFALSAASLRLDGSMSADVTGDEPEIDTVLHAENLALPKPVLRGPFPLYLLAGWHGHATLDADTLSLDLQGLATQLHADAMLAGGVLAMNMRAAKLDEATLNADMAVDASPDLPRLAMRGAGTGIPLADLPGGLTGGQADLVADLFAQGQTWPALLATSSGDVGFTLKGVSVTGLDMPGLVHLLAGRTPRLRSALQAALTSGTTTALAGNVTARLDHGAATLQAATLTGEAGTLGLEGDIDLAGQALDLRLTIRPAVPAPPALGVRLVGAWQAPRRVTDVAPGLIWAAKARPTTTRGSAAGNGP